MAQKIILIVVLLLIFFAVLFPPWTASPANTDAGMFQIHFGFMLSIPEAIEQMWVKIAVKVLALEIIAICCIGGIAYCIASMFGGEPKKKADDDEDDEDDRRR
ncbi:hypothetical protein [Dongshaea marina]|uniref:hypothetical protein n=1 Tax=Dongshaea marina TaxID=2047966 RepID=UPI000D3E0D52|nr:hypothetical protein [Dongshaea marina]